MLKTFKIILLVGLSLINGDFDSKKLKNTPMSIYDNQIMATNGHIDEEMIKVFKDII